jgi:hypothetical protein
MGLSTRVGAVALGVLLVLGLVGGATASHNIQRGVSLHYKGSKNEFKGKIKSDPPVCNGGVVTVHKIKRGPNIVIGSDSAASDGGWSVTKKARKGSFYATTPGYDRPTGALCRGVRSPVLDLG